MVRPGRLMTLIAVVILGAGFPGCSDDKIPGWTGCTTGQDCPDGMDCLNGVCRQECATSTGCPEGWQCVSGHCLQSCQGDNDCPSGQQCLNGFCGLLEVPDGGPGDADAGLGDGGDQPDAGADGRDGGGDFGTCVQAGQCQNDSHCVNGQCLPWEELEFDQECSQEAVPGPVRPQLQCVWRRPPDGDPAPDFDHVLHTPLVATLGIPPGLELPPRPCVIFISDNTYREGTWRRCEAAGTLRIIDGATCRELAAVTAEEDRCNSSVTPAVGDTDGDGLPEVVAAAAAGGVVAFGWDPDQWQFVRKFRSHHPDGSDDPHGGDTCLWGGVSLVDLTDDGLPEILFDGAVWSNLGERIASVPGWEGYPWGVPAAAADIDEDGRVELVAGEGVWEFDGAGFVLEAGFSDPGFRGFTAIADFGDFPDAAGDAPGRPEIVVVGSQHLVLLSMGGTVLRDLTAPSVGGGPPTVADYDGDMLPEIGAAFASHYLVYDVADDGILWSQPSQDLSSARTGSSVFDFNGDGRAEVVYGDECYVRVYDGQTGEVIFSQARFSSTWEENPIVADVDGDSAAEMVMGMSGACHPGYCPEWDPLFAGLRCDQASDCPGGDCSEGLCRCDADDQCTDTYGCSEPLPNTPGSGNVCRARHLDCEPGLRIYRDGRDRWAASRPIWNQHAYHITNVEDDGRIPSTSQMKPNWAQPGLNNFRQNGQGDLADIPRPDLAVGNLIAYCEQPGTTRLSADVCNRGAALSDMGIEVIFTGPTGEELCRLRTDEPVPPGYCHSFSCVAQVEAEGEFEAIVDPDGIVTECHESNNTAQGQATCWET